MSTLNSTTSTTRPTLGAGDVGKSYFETDSNKILVWDSAAWREWNYDLVTTPGADNNNFSLSVDGVDDYLNCGNIGDLAGSTAYTLAFWWKPSVSGESPSIGVRQNISNQYHIYKSNFIIATGGVSPSSKTKSFTEPTGTDWRYYVLSYDAGSVFLHINGTQIFSETGFPPSLMTSTSSTHALQIGRYTTLSGSSFNSQGLIDEVALWDSALSTSAAITLYNSGNAFDVTADSGSYNDSANLIGYWKFEGNGNATRSNDNFTIAGGSAIVNK